MSILEKNQIRDIKLKIFNSLKLIIILKRYIIIKKIIKNLKFLKLNL